MQIFAIQKRAAYRLLAGRFRIRGWHQNSWFVDVNDCLYGKYAERFRKKTIWIQIQLLGCSNWASAERLNARPNGNSSFSRKTLSAEKAEIHRGLIRKDR